MASSHVLVESTWENVRGKNQCVLKAGNGEIQVMWMGPKEGVGNTPTCFRLSSAGFVIEVAPCRACTGKMGADMDKRGVCAWGS